MKLDAYRFGSACSDRIDELFDLGPGGYWLVPGVCLREWLDLMLAGDYTDWERELIEQDSGGGE